MRRDEQFWATPDDTDVLIVHGPPAGYGDQTDRGPAVGSQAFVSAIDRVTPALAIFGHIHEGRGTWTRNATTLANVSTVDLNYELTENPTLMFEL